VGAPHARALLLGGLIVVAGLTVLLSTPRPSALGMGSPRAAYAAQPVPPATPPVMSTPRTTTSIGATAVRIPEPDASGRVVVPLADQVPGRMPAVGVPLGWEKIEFAGRDPAIELTRTDGRLALRLRSEKNSFAVHRDLVLDVRKYPILTWSWKVAKLPTGGDVREPLRDDQAAQVYVVFPRWPTPRTASDVIGYVWDTHAPVGTSIRHPRAPNVRIIVLESGSGRLDTWLHEQRNVAEDYKTLFGGQPPRAGKIALMIDTNDTKSAAEALFGELTFSRLPVSSH
jgi:DUF3047 family protein